MIDSSALHNCSTQFHLRFFDVDIVVHSDSPSFLAQIEHLHAGARTANAAENRPASHHLRVEFYTHPGSGSAEPALILDGRRYPLPDRPEIAGYIYGLITMHAAQRVRSHILIHAGAVARNGQGVILVADSMHGKTTLTLELLRRGFCLLSDDVAAVGREDGLLHAYPRALLVRPGSLELTGLQPPSTGHTWNGKLLLSAEEIGVSRCAEPVPVAHIVVMQDAPKPWPGHNGASSSDKSQGVDLALLLSTLDTALLYAIRDLDVVVIAEPLPDSPLPALRLRVSSATRALDQIQALCTERHVLILDYVRKTNRPPSFDRPARLEPMSKHDALIALVRGFRAGHASALLTEKEKGQGAPASLVMELADIVAVAPCHRLHVGSLPASADLICHLLEVTVYSPPP